MIFRIRMVEMITLIKHILFVKVFIRLQRELVEDRVSKESLLKTMIGREDMSRLIKQLETS